MKKALLIILLIIILAAFGGYIFFQNWYNNAIYTPASTEEKDVTVEVKEGENLISILPSLKEKGLISNEDAVKIYLRLNNIAPVIKVGNYTIPSTVNVPELIELLEKGVFKSSVLVTIKEGLRYEQIADILDEKFSELEDRKFDKQEFLNICSNPDIVEFSDEVKVFLQVAKPSGKPLRGFLFPDTYRFNTDATAQNVIETLISNFKTRLEENDIEVKGNSTLSDFYKILILASIIEKEASKSDDPSLISGVFYNRLDENYPLQADSTVNFITGKNDPGVLISDSKIDSPYNTYKYPGLPPTPIDNPGIRSIKAAVDPQTTDFFFFVHDANGNGYFAKTFEEHQLNIAKYL